MRNSITRLVLSLSACAWSGAQDDSAGSGETASSDATENDPDKPTTSTTVIDGGMAASSGGGGWSAGGMTTDGTVSGDEEESSGTGDDTTSGTTGHAPLCGDGVVEGDEACDDMNDIPDDGCKACARDSVVFITSERYRGDLKGLDGADQRCRMLAAIAGLQRFETFRAWLSTAEMAAADRLLKSPGRYVLVNGLVVAEDWDGLVSGALLHPIDVDENSQTQDYRAWTGTVYDGQPSFGSEFCDGWTSFSGDFMGGSGLSSVVDETWSYFEDALCGFDLHLYCIEQ